MKKTIEIFFQITPIIIMVGLIPFIQNDYTLTLAYIIIILLSSLFNSIKRNDKIFFVFGFFAMIISEYFFIHTGVEVFVRNSLFGAMPLWLPFLWGYGFVVMKKSIEILDK